MDVFSALAHESDTLPISPNRDGVASPSRALATRSSVLHASQTRPVWLCLNTASATSVNVDITTLASLHCNLSLTACNAVLVQSMRR